MVKSYRLSVRVKYYVLDSEVVLLIDSLLEIELLMTLSDYNYIIVLRIMDYSKD